MFNEQKSSDNVVAGQIEIPAQREETMSQRLFAQVNAVQDAARDLIWQSDFAFMREDACDEYRYTKQLATGHKLVLLATKNSMQLLLQTPQTSLCIGSVTSPQSNEEETRIQQMTDVEHDDYDYFSQTNNNTFNSNF